MKISKKECEQKRLTSKKLSIALRQLRENGYVVLERVLPPAWVEEIRIAFENKLKHQKPENGRGGIQADFNMPYMDPHAVENPWGLQIIEAVMGKDIWSILPYHTNTSWPGAGMQDIHRDTHQLFPGFSVPLPPSMLIIHIPLVDFTEENGSTEIWPGTHLITDSDPDMSKSEHLADRAQYIPSVRTNMPAGSVMVRDMRIWHRGMPNQTDIIRTMLSIVYFHPLHRFPTHLVHMDAIPQRAIDSLPERAQHIYRYHPVEGHTVS